MSRHTESGLLRRTSNAALLTLLFSLISCMSGGGPSPSAAETRSAPSPVIQAQGQTPSAASGAVKGVVVKIEGNFYVIKDDEGKEIRLLVSRDTELAGAFKPGDRIEVHISPVEHAMSIAVVTAQTEPPGAPSHTIRGELVKIEGRHYVIKDAGGKEVRLHISEDTKLPEGLKPGDMIEAQVAPLEHAMFIKATQ